MDVAQTPDGYLWIATLMGGVSRFDGVRFVNFDLENTPELGGPTTVRRLFTDAAGALWMNTYAGLVRYRDGRFAVELNKDPGIEALVTSGSNHVLFATSQSQLLRGWADNDGRWDWEFLSLSNAVRFPQHSVDAAGAVWYLRSDHALGRWTGKGCEVVSADAGLGGQQPSALAVDVAGRIWVGTDRELAVWEEGQFRSATPKNGEDTLAVRRIIPAAKGSLWVDANGRLRRCVGGEWVAEAKGLESLGNWARQFRLVRADAEGGLWITFQGMGLLHVAANGEVARVSTVDGLPSNLLRCLFVDREENLWTGHDRGGLVRIRPRQFQTVAKAEGLLDTVVTSVCEDRDGAVWIGTVGGTLGRWCHGECTNFTLPMRGSMCQNLVVCPDAAGRLWIGTQGNGVLMLENGTFKHVLPPDWSRDGGVRMILAARDGCLWVGTVNSLYTLEDRKLTKVREAKGTEDQHAALAETADGTIWLGTTGGALLRYHGSGFESFRPSDGVAASRFWAMWPDADGTLWIGTYGGGLLRFRDGEFKRFALRSGLRRDRITEVLGDDQGYLWLGTRAGIERVAKSALEELGEGGFKPLQSRVYGRGDGLLTVGTSVEFQPKCWRGQDGRLWFGMANGVASVHPTEIRPSPVPPRMVIEEVRVDGNTLADEAWRDLDRAPAGRRAAGWQSQSSGALKLGPGEHDLEIRFTAPMMTAPEAMRLRCQLVGLDHEWSEVGAERMVRYRALPPGEYSFQAAAYNCDGVRSEGEANLAITVLPNFWQTRWFLPVVAISLAGLTGGGVALVLRARHRRRLARLELRRAREAERARISQDLHDDLGASLTEISMLATLQPGALPASAQSADRLNLIGGKARATIHALDEIVWAVDPRHDSLASLVDYLGGYFTEVLENSGLSAHLEVGEAIPMLTLNAESRHSLFLAVKEALNNVIRHSRATEVRCRVGVAEGAFQIVIEDNGCGFEAARVASGNGLANLRQRLAKLGGKCEITSQTDRGTRVLFQLPIGSPEANV